jgi:imidazolonepropionase-like amidohydrolase
MEETFEQKHAREAAEYEAKQARLMETLREQGEKAAAAKKARFAGRYNRFQSRPVYQVPVEDARDDIELMRRYNEDRNSSYCTEIE